MAGEDKITDYDLLFGAVDIEEMNALERIFCASNETYRREIGDNPLNLADPADYCRAVIGRSIDYDMSGGELSHMSLITPYLYILRDKGYQVNEESAQVLQDLITEDVNGPARDRTQPYTFNPFGLAPSYAFTVTPGLAFDAGAVESAQHRGLGVDVEEYRGVAGSALLAERSEQCFLNNQPNPLVENPEQREPLTVQQCYEAGAAFSAIHINPDLALGTADTVAPGAVPVSVRNAAVVAP